MRIGYIGLGNMGGALALRLQRSQNLHVFDLNPEALERLSSKGSIVCHTPRELGKSCDIVLTCLQTSAQVRSVIFGKDGLVEGLAAGAVVIDQTTGDAFETRTMHEELAKQDIHLVDAPVSGGPPGASAGTIAIMVGASEELFTRVEPVLRAISSNVFHVGGVGAGHVMKVVNNLLTAAQRAMTHEVMCLAVKNGVDPSIAVKVLQAGAGQNYTLNNTYPRHILPGKMFQCFTLALMHKDVSLANALAAKSAVPLFFGALVREHYQAAINEFGAASDVNEALGLFERQAQTKVRGVC